MVGSLTMFPAGSKAKYLLSMIIHATKQFIIITIQAKTLQTLATEMFKVYKKLSPAIIADLFHVRQNNYNLGHNSFFAILNVKSVYHGTECLSNLGPRTRNLVSDKLKQLVDIHAFKKEIKKWKPKNYPCRLYKTYIPNFVS